MTHKTKSVKRAIGKLKVLFLTANWFRPAPLGVMVAILILIWQPSFGEVAQSSNRITTAKLENSLIPKSSIEESSLNQAPAMTSPETGNAERTEQGVEAPSARLPATGILVARWDPSTEGRVGSSLSEGKGSVGRQRGFELEQKVRALFANLPATKAFRIWAPATRNDLPFLVELNGQERLFSASANKAYILCERLRQLDSPNVEERLVSHELELNKDVWSIGSPVLNPPDLSGLVSERTAMEAMITHSDNTATDMILKEAGVGPVRHFIGSIGLTSTMIPDSTRALAGYLLGAPNYLTITYDELSALKPIFLHPPLNNVETFASSPNDLVSFYQRALEGRFFRNAQTLEQFRRILSLGDIGPLVGFPLGASVFGKAGYFDIAGQHARCIAGGMYFHDRWIYFATILNWDAPALQDPLTVEAFYSALRKSLALVP